MRRRLPLGLLSFAAVAVLCVVVAGVVGGGRSALSAGLGAFITVLFFGSTPAILGPVVTAAPRLSMFTAMAFYLTKVFAVLALFVVLAEYTSDGHLLHARALAGTVIVCTMAWIGGRVLDEVRCRRPMYDLTDTTQPRPDRFGAQ